jgi:hypothetical protein
MSDDAIHDNTGFAAVEADATERTSPTATQAPEGWDDQFPEDEFDEPTPRSRLPLITKVLAAVLVCGLFFTAGSFAQKHFGPSTGTTVAGIPDFAAAGGFPTGGLPGAGQAADAPSGAVSGATTSAAGPAVIGRVTKVDGDTITVEDFGGTTHLVKTDTSTKIVEETTLPLDDLTTGSSVTVTGSTNDDGTINAIRVTAR